MTHGTAVWRPVVKLPQESFAESEGVCEDSVHLESRIYVKFDPEEHHEDLPLQRRRREEEQEKEEE